MSASAPQERAGKNRRYLPHEDSYVPREDYYRQWQVDPECVKADGRELGRIENHIVRTAVYRLIALREATVLGARDWLPDPRLVSPELRARTTRRAMDLVARLLMRVACEARGAGWSWGELASSVIVREEFPNWTISGAKAFESVTGQTPGLAKMQTLTWRCGSCNQKITDHGPYGHPSDCESGHADDCARHDQEAAAYECGARPAIDPTLLRAGPQGEEDNSTENLCRIVRSVRCSCVRCFYCERVLASRRVDTSTTTSQFPDQLAVTKWCQPAWTATN
ncbi:hypothetical protein [Amycolatopsis saalfeldensis]|uniref:Uncharacterized protein n=1 Tax=Amycolatopsis saalfeldensis TaxID=394193 RepID=A0A1H8YPS3_9PSEU|nr:hypothetical protein [Amycolatopsis saalfeldensis]SEP53368.1 hypothetical protein SAMN04489732_12692 [Amycolatopsis saalfeldensis]